MLILLQTSLARRFLGIVTGYFIYGNAKKTAFFIDSKILRMNCRQENSRMRKGKLNWGLVLAAASAKPPLPFWIMLREDTSTTRS